MNSLSYLPGEILIKEKKLKDFKLVAIDMDGTVLNEKHELNDHTIEVIQQVEKQGLTILLATGRMISAVTKHLGLLGTSGLVVSHNGALVKDVYKNKVYLHHTVPSSVVDRVLSLHNEQKFVLHINVDDDVYVNRENTLSKKYAKELGIELSYISDYKNIHSNPTSILLLQSKEKLELILYDLQMHYPNTFDYVLIPWSKGIWMLQFLPINTSKGKAVLETAKQLNINPEEIISFGDSYNDLEMIEHTGLGVAMGNACDELKDIADYITKLNSEDGVAYVLEELLKND